MSLLAHLAELAGAAIAVPWARIVARRDRVTIVGWWGSETTGDVAILGQLLAECAEVAPGVAPTVVSFAPARTHETLRELGRADVKLLPLGFRSGWAAATGRCVVFGGGPLMESPRMPLWAALAALARAAGARVMLYGNGIGPVRRARTERSIAALVELATHRVLRDPRAADWGDGLARRRGAIVSFDPAFAFVRERVSAVRRRDPARLALALRFPPASYLNGLAREDECERLVTVVAAALNRVMSERPLMADGIVMQTGHPDDDDHAVYERLRARLDRPERLRVASGRHTVDHVVRTIESCGAALTVRFHAMIFALAADTPFVAIDYARPSGKVSAAAAFAGRSDSVLPWDDLEADALADRLRALLDRSGESNRAPLPDTRAPRMRVLAEALSR